MKARELFVSFSLLLVLMPLLSEAQNASTDSIMNHVRELSSSRYEGRLSGTDAFLDAADYVVGTLQRYGVKPYKGEWSQYFETECNQIENCTFNTYVNSNDVKDVYVLGRDFCCFGVTGRGYADAPVVFCGYGIASPAFDEYADVDAKGKIAMVLSGVPDFLPSSVTDAYTQVRSKARAAFEHGACALVVVNMSSMCAPYEVQGSVYGGDLPHMATFPMIQVTRECAARLLENEKYSVDKVVKALDEERKPQSFHMRKKFVIEVNTKYHPAALTANVVGVYPGVDAEMKNEYIVVGASLDHVGQQGTTCLFPGANGNASGVAALLETARMLTLSPDQPSRNVLFVLFSSSEQQYLGSRIFVSNFKPLKGIEAYIDVSEVGCGDSIMVQGNNRYPSLWDVARKVDTSYGTSDMVVGMKTNPKGNSVAFDHIGIPSINITGYNGRKHYKVPSDISENINRQLLTKSTQLLFETVLDLSFGQYQGRSYASRRVKFNN